MLGPPPRRRRRFRPSRRVLAGGAIVALAVAAVLVSRVIEGRGQRIEDAPRHPVAPTAQERRWLTRYAEWFVWIEAVKSGPSIRLLLRCDDELERRAGAPPSEGLKDYVRVAGDACRQLESGHRQTVQATVNQDADLLERGLQATQDGERLLRLAESSLPELARVQRPSARAAVLSWVATALSGTPADVWCWTRKGWRDVAASLDAELGGTPGVIGTAAFSRGRIDLSAEVCDPVRSLGDASWSLDERAYAVGVLAHEIAHLRGHENEAVAECTGMQLIRNVAPSLGVSRSEAAVLARVYWTTFYPLNDPRYRTPRCRDGGPLDRRRGSSVWP